MKGSVKTCGKEMVVDRGKKREIRKLIKEKRSIRREEEEEEEEEERGRLR